MTNSNARAKEPSFRESVDIMFNRAVSLMELPPGLEEKIRVCNATYTVRFGVRLRGKIDKKFDTPMLNTVRGAGYILRATKA